MRDYRRSDGVPLARGCPDRADSLHCRRGGFFAAFLCLAFVLRRGMALGVAYGIWGAAGVAATAVASTWLYGDPFTPLMTAGMVLIIAGVLVVELGSQRARWAQESVEADS